MYHIYVIYFFKRHNNKKNKKKLKNKFQTPSSLVLYSE